MRISVSRHGICFWAGHSCAMINKSVNWRIEKGMAKGLLHFPCFAIATAPFSHTHWARHGLHGVVAASSLRYCLHFLFRASLLALLPNSCYNFLTMRPLASTAKNDKLMSVYTTLCQWVCHGNFGPPKFFVRGTKIPGKLVRWCGRTRCPPGPDVPPDMWS